MATSKVITDAWNEYLIQTRHCDNRRYEDVEPWAWAKLQQILDQNKPNKKVVKRKVPANA